MGEPTSHVQFLVATLSYTCTMPMFAPSLPGIFRSDLQAPFRMWTYFIEQLILPQGLISKSCQMNDGILYLKKCIPANFDFESDCWHLFAKLSWCQQLLVYGKGLCVVSLILWYLNLVQYELCKWLLDMSKLIDTSRICRQVLKMKGSYPAGQQASLVSSTLAKKTSSLNHRTHRYFCGAETSFSRGCADCYRQCTET